MRGLASDLKFAGKKYCQKYCKKYCKKYCISSSYRPVTSAVLPDEEIALPQTAVSQHDWEAIEIDSSFFTLSQTTILEDLT